MIPPKKDFTEQTVSAPTPPQPPPKSARRAAIPKRYKVNEDRVKALNVLEALGYDRRTMEEELKAMGR